jgi:23S rRNA (uracil1939-C5)-methyltransferase
LSELKKNSVIRLTAGKMVHQGVCLSEYQGRIVFVENCIPGEEVQAKIIKVKRDYVKAAAVEIISRSTNRVNSKCMHFGICGGCKIQHIDYKKQLDIKKDIVEDIMKRIGKIREVKIENTIGSDAIFYYRNKMEYSFSNKRWLETDINYSANEKNFSLGLHIPNIHDKILHLKECWLQSELSNKVRNVIGKFLYDKNISIHSLKERSGLLKALTIRESFNTYDKMVNLITTRSDEVLMQELREVLKKDFPEVTTFVNSISNSNLSSTISYETNVIFGRGSITEILLGKKFEIYPNTFFQTNTRQAEKLFSLVKEIITNDNLTYKSQNKILIDLFCGVGVIGIVLADQFDFVYGIEISNESVFAARRNARENSLKNIEFFVSNLDQEFDYSKFESIQNDLTVILDPPRAGISEKTIFQLKVLKPRLIIYISCNPSTLARDIERLSACYRPQLIQPIDFFPHTYHIENLVILEIL